MLGDVIDRKRFTDALESACKRIDRLANHIRGAFENVKQYAILNYDKSLASVNMEDLRCYTAPRVIRMNELCKYAQNPEIPYKPVA